MPKRRREPDAGNGDGTADAAPVSGERMPPPLSEELIEKLRAAVDAAQRRRMPQRNPTDSEPGD